MRRSHARLLAIPLFAAACSALTATLPAPARAAETTAAAEVGEHADFSATLYDYRKELTAHPHNKIVHFPVALTIVAFVFALLSVRWAGLFPATRLLVILAAAGAAAARLTGPLQEMEFLMSPLKPILHLHARFAQYTLYALGACVVLSFLPNSRRWLWVPLLVAAALVSVTGYFGGILATS